MSSITREVAEHALQKEQFQLIIKITKCLRETRKIDDKRKLELITTTEKVGKQLIRIQIDFKKSTLQIINAALACSEEDITQRKHHGERYRRLFDSAILRSETLANGINSVLHLIVEKDPKLTRKYKLFITGTIVVPLVGSGVCIGLIAGHCTAACALTLGTGGIAGVAIGAGICIAITAYFIYKLAQKRHERFDKTSLMGEKHDDLRDVLRKYFSKFEEFFSHGYEMEVTDSMIQESIEHALQSMKTVDGTTWTDDDFLQDFRQITQESLNVACELCDNYETNLSNAA